VNEWTEKTTLNPNLNGRCSGGDFTLRFSECKSGVLAFRRTCPLLGSACEKCVLLNKDTRPKIL
jgi:hypothetical protein